MDDSSMMRRALRLAAGVQGLTSPNPWVGCVVVGRDGSIAEGVTHPPGGPHAEVDALSRLPDAVGSTLYVTLEPCAHHGRTPPCAEAIVSAGVRRVVVAITDPDPRVSGRGLDRLRAAGIEVIVGEQAEAGRAVLAPYLHHRTTGRPHVVLKLAATLDGRTAAPDATSKWITGPEARADVQLVRARSDAILVGAGTIRADDPELTVRDVEPPLPGTRFEPRRVVLGRAPSDARAQPLLEVEGELGGVLDDLGARGILQLLVEGGASVAGQFHRGGLVDRYVVYFAPALFGGDDARPLMAGAGAPTIDALWRGRIDAVRRLGDDLRIDMIPAEPARVPHSTPRRHEEALS